MIRLWKSSVLSSASTLTELSAFTTSISSALLKRGLVEASHLLLDTRAAHSPVISDLRSRRIVRSNLRTVEAVSRGLCLSSLERMTLLDRCAEGEPLSFSARLGRTLALRTSTKTLVIGPREIELPTITSSGESTSTETSVDLATVLSLYLRMNQHFSDRQENSEWWGYE